MPSRRSSDRATGLVVIAVDPHKASWTAVAVDSHLRPLDAIRVPVSRDGYRQLRAFARHWPQATWAVEGAGGLGAPLTTRLAEDDITVLDVPAKLARRVRLLSSGHSRKTDEADALSVGVAAHTATRLHEARIDEAIAALRSLTEHREDLVRARTQTVNRLHALVTKLVPAGLPRTLRSLAVDLVAEVRRLDRRINTVTDQISAAVTESASTLTELHGIGDLMAARILARTGSIDRFRSAAAFASFCGVAPLEVSSGDVQRHRLSRAGDRQLNAALHVMAITQIRHKTAGQAYYQRKRSEGKSHKEALRCLKRRLSDVVYRTMLKDSGTSLIQTA